MPSVWYGWAPWESEMPHVWHGWAPVGERGAPSLARLGPRTQAYKSTWWAGEEPAAPVDTLVQVGVVTVGFPTSLFL